MNAPQAILAATCSSRWVAYGCVALAVAVAVPARAAPPVAPGPESVTLDPEVFPASHIAVPASHEGRAAPIPLAGPTATGPASPAARPLPDWRLLAVLGAAFAVVAAYRALSGRRTAMLPPDVFEVLGEASLGGQQSVRVVRFGPRTLLIGVSTAGAQTLAEIVDPQATERVVAACRGAQSPVRGGRRPAAEGRT